jgi:hypothetical protein
MKNVISNPSMLAEQIAEDNSLMINETDIHKILQQLSHSEDDRAILKVISLFKKAIKRIEQKMWQQQPSARDIKHYQSTFKALEKVYELRNRDERCNFRIVIPVADRPQHLKQCLNSLLTLCRSYEYGGFSNSQYSKISVLISDDSKSESNISLHKEYCSHFTAAGLATEYFGLKEQLELVNNITEQNNELSNIIGNAGNITDDTDFSHKGASIMRNITYLKLQHEMLPDDSADNTLIYFIDSDQEFCINSPLADTNSYAINYFHYLDEIFQTQKVTVLTGKVVGDPPVSPSVMAGNFQRDVRTFLKSIAGLEPADDCQFHQHNTINKDDAAYHDMARLFGFTGQEQVFDYHCTLQGKHTNADCFTDFSEKLGHFFYGEHPTRKTFFNYENGFAVATPARTVYTGNYVIRPEALTYFIPFATLKLRMAGPVLGRILKAKLKDSFVSANLPMLHNRTVESIGQSEFRAGVENNREHIDLSNEFIRQFYGDVMLFTMEKITETGFPETRINDEKLDSILRQTCELIRDNYIDKHHTVLELMEQIKDQLKDPACWWNKPADTDSITAALTNFHNFLNNIRTNFDDDSKAYQQITKPQNTQNHLDNIHQAIKQYDNDLMNWQNALNNIKAIQSRQ